MDRKRATESHTAQLSLQLSPLSRSSFGAKRTPRRAPCQAKSGPSTFARGQVLTFKFDAARKSGRGIPDCESVGVELVELAAEQITAVGRVAGEKVA